MIEQGEKKRSGEATWWGLWQIRNASAVMLFLPFLSCSFLPPSLFPFLPLSLPPYLLSLLLPSKIIEHLPCVKTEIVSELRARNMQPKSNCMKCLRSHCIGTSGAWVKSPRLSWGGCEDFLWEAVFKLMHEGWVEVSQEKKELGREKVIHKANRVCGRQAEGSPGELEGWRAGF